MDSVGVKPESQDAILCYFDKLSKLRSTDVPNHDEFLGCFPEITK